MSQGKLLWAMGFGSRMKEDAEFKLAKGRPVLVLVDDPEFRLDSPVTRTQLARKLGTELKEQKAAAKIIPQSRLDRLRREHPNFEGRGCREVGRMAGADQVVWLEIRDLYARAEVEDTSAAARMTATVKVINALSERKGEVRLWPVEREGRIVTAEMTADKVIRAKKVEVITAVLTDDLAKQIAKLFYDHPLEDE